MNYTREPIIETVITPKQGCKLVVRNSKGASSEDYFVDAIEIVSFGQSLFYRSLERPKSFLLPVSDYEVIEVKETKMVLKTAGMDKSIKIGGGKENPPPQEEPSKKDKKRSRRRKSNLKEVRQENQQPVKKENLSSEKGGDAVEETQVSSSVIRKLFPPPKALIKEKLAQAGDQGYPQESIPAEAVTNEPVLSKDEVDAGEVTETIEESFEKDSISEENFKNEE